MSSRPATTPSNTLTCGWVKPKSTCTIPLYLRMVENSEVKNIVYARPDGQNDYNFRETRRPTHRRFALTYLFFKIRSSNFQSCFVSAWNAHFRCLFGLDRPGRGTIFEFLKISKTIKFRVNYIFLEFQIPKIVLLPGLPKPKRHRKWAFQNETKELWKSELLTLKNKKVRANLRFPKSAKILLIFSSNFLSFYQTKLANALLRTCFMHVWGNTVRPTSGFLMPVEHYNVCAQKSWHNVP